MAAAETILCHKRFGNHPEAPAIKIESAFAGSIFIPRHLRLSHDRDSLLAPDRAFEHARQLVAMAHSGAFRGPLPYAFSALSIQRLCVFHDNMSINMKYDDADWHESDAGSEKYAAVHIALLFVWLANNGYVKREWFQESDLKSPLSKKLSPTEYLYHYMDGKLIDSVLTQDGKVLCDKYYDQYLNDYANQNIKGFWYDHSRGKNPYCGKDTWWNLRPINKYFSGKKY